jgi:hypothetical protein
MCDACEDWDAREPRQGVHPGLARRAREIERRMEGPRAPDAAWRIALGQQSGAIPWADHLRIVTAFQAAASAERPYFVGRRSRTRLACEATA